MTYFHVNSLEQLKSTEACVLYPRAAVMPEIFARNLLSDRKIVKEFKGDDALVRAFYYQLMKLSFEIEV